MPQCPVLHRGQVPQRGPSREHGLKSQRDPVTPDCPVIQSAQFDQGRGKGAGVARIQMALVDTEMMRPVILELMFELRRLSINKIILLAMLLMMLLLPQLFLLKLMMILLVMLMMILLLL